MTDVWTAVGISAAVASACAAIVSSAVVLWLRRRDKPEPDWIYARLGVPLTRSLMFHIATVHAGKDPDFLVMVTNAGDGEAFQVEAEGLDADVELFIRDVGDARGWRVPSKIARVSPEGEFGVLIWYHPNYDPDRIGFRLRWLNTPTRHGRYGGRDIHFADQKPRPHLWKRAAGWIRQRRAGATDSTPRSTHQ